MCDQKNNKPDEQFQNPILTELILNEDYYINKQGQYVFTEKYLLKRGYCCKNRCLHCPYEFKRGK